MELCIICDMPLCFLKVALFKNFYNQVHLLFWLCMLPQWIWNETTVRINLKVWWKIMAEPCRNYSSFSICTPNFTKKFYIKLLALVNCYCWKSLIFLLINHAVFFCAHSHPIKSIHLLFKLQLKMQQSYASPDKLRSLHIDKRLNRHSRQSGWQWILAALSFNTATPLHHCVSTVEALKFMGSTISQDLRWETNINFILKKIQQRMYFLWQLRKF